MNKILNKICFYSRPDNDEAKKWQLKIESWLTDKYPRIKIAKDEDETEAVIVLGGDGTIMEAVRRYAKQDVVILGLNLGQLGFLSSIDSPDDFIPMLDRFLRGDYKTISGLTIKGDVIREGKTIFSADAFNEIVIQSPLGMVEIGVDIGGEEIQKIRGSGVLVSTPFGSTAYNLSAHGPVVVPGIPCLILTELFDHSLPTPSVVVPADEVIDLVVKDFRERKLLKVTASDEYADVLFIADGIALFVLKQGDKIQITHAQSAFRLAELQPNHFFRSLHNKFEFK
jgi:NAD+ kinase